jgi:Zn finger protein HypA/HybF involved in hydrogenase expression
VDHVAIRCPACRSIDWYRDGFAMRELEDGTILCQRLTTSADQDTPWSCAVCGHEVAAETLLRRHLAAAAQAAQPPPVGQPARR